MCREEKEVTGHRRPVSPLRGALQTCSPNCSVLPEEPWLCTYSLGPRGHLRDISAPEALLLVTVSIREKYFTESHGGVFANAPSASRRRSG